MKPLTTEPSLIHPEYFQNDEEEIPTIREALQNIVDSADKNSPAKYGVYIIEQIDFDNAVAALKRGV